MAEILNFVDLNNQKQSVKNYKQHPISASQINELTNELTQEDKGFSIYDIDNLNPLWWDGNNFVSTKIDIDTGSLVFTSSFNPFTSSYYTDSSSFDNRINNIIFDTGSLVNTSSFNNFTSSFNTGSFTGSFIGNLSGTASYVNVISSLGYTPANIIHTHSIADITNLSSSLASKLNKNISILPTASLPLSNSDLFLVNQNGIDKTLPKSELGGSDYLQHKVRWIAFRLNSINFWYAPYTNYFTFDNEAITTWGSGTIPTITTGGYHKVFDSIPDGYIIDKIQLEINYKLEGSSNSELQVYIERSEIDEGSNSSGVSNTMELVNEIVIINAGSSQLKFIYDLTVASHSLPILSKSFTQASVRETLATDIYYSLGFNFLYKKV